MHSEMLRREIEWRAQHMHGPRGQSYPDVIVVTEDGEQSLDWQITDIGLGEPGKIVIFTKSVE